MLARNLAVSIILAVVSVGCGTVRGPDSIIRATGHTVPVEKEDKGQFKLFKKAAEEALTASENFDADAPTKAGRMRQLGSQLVQQNCRDYFETAGENQKWLLFGKDAIGVIGTIATGILSARGGSETAAENVAIATAVGYAGIDLYTRNFLFSAENIGSVEDLVVKALASYEEKAAEMAPGNYGEAALLLMDHQAICSPSRIAALVKSAIKKAEIETRPTDEGLTRVRDIGDRAFRQRLGEALGLQTLASERQALALYWYAIRADADDADRREIAARLSGLPVGACPFLTCDGTATEAATRWEKRDEVLRALVLMGPGMHRDFDAQIAELRAARGRQAAAQAQGAPAASQPPVMAPAVSRSVKRLSTDVR